MDLSFYLANEQVQTGKNDCSQAKLYFLLNTQPLNLIKWILHQGLKFKKSITFRILSLQ